jgi:hypothetical protein
MEYNQRLPLFMASSKLCIGLVKTGIRTDGSERVASSPSSNLPCKGICGLLLNELAAEQRPPMPRGLPVPSAQVWESLLQGQQRRPPYPFWRSLDGGHNRQIKRCVFRSRGRAVLFIHLVNNTVAAPSPCCRPRRN